MPYRDPVKRKEYHRRYMRRLREKLRIKKKAEEERKIEAEIALGNINYGLDEKERYMSWEEYKKAFPNATIESYNKARKGFLEAQGLEVDPDELKFKHIRTKPETLKILFNVPFDPDKREKCSGFRAQMLRLKPRGSLAQLEKHERECRFCQAWYKKNQFMFTAKSRGYDLWHGHERSKPTREETDEMNQEILREAMEERYGEDMGERVE